MPRQRRRSGALSSSRRTVSPKRPKSPRVALASTTRPWWRSGRLKSFPQSDSPESLASERVSTVVDHLFRREAGRLVAILTRRFGPEHMHLAEDVVQDALVRAMETWPFTGVPENPTAWVLQTACNRALDQK